MPNGQRARVVGRKALSPRVTELTLELEGGAPFHFRAGQHLTLRPDVDEAERSAFSLALAPTPAGLARLILAVSNTSELLGRAALDSVLVLEGPFGELVWHPAPGALLVGAGTGVAPLRALVHEALALDERTPLVLVAGNRSREELLWHDELRALAEEHARLRYEPVLSRPEADWPGRRGYVQSHIADIVPSLPAGSRAYLCGSTSMVVDCRSSLLALGVPDERILSEADA